MNIVGYLEIPLIYFLTFLLNRIVPSVSTAGYACDSFGTALQYRLNGMRVHLLVCTLMTLLHLLGFVSLTVFSQQFWTCLVLACSLGIVLSALLFVRGRKLHVQKKIDERTYCLTSRAQPYNAAELATTSDEASEFRARSWLDHFYCGYEWNPRPLLGVDVKMWLYLVGAIQLELNVLGAVFDHYELHGRVSNAMVVYLLCLSWFTAEYLYFENVHLFTYDLFRERIGFKLTWGCTTFYPFFYCCGVWCLVSAAPSQRDMSLQGGIACCLLFAFGWLVTRGANLQKFHCKMGHEQFLFGLVKMNFVPDSKRRLLCSGFWGLSRHINYFGELVQSIALALPGWLVTGSIVPWLYPLYYVILFVPRQIDDDRICAAKYGKVWHTYCRLVPYRIIPYIW